jgi:hypothetical protein
MIDERTPTIRLSKINTDRLDDVEDNHEAVSFRIQLTESPSDLWINEFEVLYRGRPYALKPPVQVEDDELVIYYLPRYTRELPDYLRFVAMVVASANEELVKTQELHAAGTHDRNKMEFREALRRQKLPGQDESS